MVLELHAPNMFAISASLLRDKLTDKMFRFQNVTILMTVVSFAFYLIWPMILYVIEWHQINWILDSMNQLSYLANLCRRLNGCCSKFRDSIFLWMKICDFNLESNHHLFSKPLFVHSLNTSNLLCELWFKIKKNISGLFAAYNDSYRIVSSSI